MALSSTSICNMALGRIGEKRIADYTDTTENNVPAVLCRLHYEQTRNALLRSHLWRFARKRAELSANITDPIFEWDYAYDLPADFLRLWIKPFEDNNVGWHNTRYSYSIEGSQLLSNEDEMNIRYISKVTDETKFDPLFVEVFILKLAMKFVMSLTGDKELYMVLGEELREVMKRVRAMDKQETNTIGQGEMFTWNNARLTGASGDPAHSYS